jgi:hypothetical protein
LETDIKIYALFRDYVKHEDALVNNRLTWILTIHGFLYATYGLTIQKRLEIIAYISNSIFVHLNEQEQFFHAANLPYYLLEIRVFLIFLCFIGSFISGYGFVSIRAAHRASSSLRQIFEEQFKKFEPSWYPDVPNLRYLGDEEKYFVVPTIEGAGRERFIKVGLIASLTIPLILLGGWVSAALWELFGRFLF